MTLADFTEQAETYTKARPGYPDQLIDLLIEDAGLGPTEAMSSQAQESGSFDQKTPVVDFGAGDLG